MTNKCLLTRSLDLLSSNRIDLESVMVAPINITPIRDSHVDGNTWTDRMNAFASRRSKILASAKSDEEYKALNSMPLEIPSHLNLKQNYLEAKKMNVSELVHKIKSRAAWDFKTNSAARGNHYQFNSDLGKYEKKFPTYYADFGNWHFGFVTHATKFTHFKFEAIAAGGIYALKQEKADFSSPETFFDDKRDTEQISAGWEAAEITSKENIRLNIAENDCSSAKSRKIGNKYSGYAEAY